MAQTPHIGFGDATRNVVIPSWSEQAVLVLTSPSGDRIIVAEGPLDVVTRELATRRPRWAGLSVSLPDRQVAPFDYGPDTLADLVSAWTIDRDASHRPRHSSPVD